VDADTLWAALLRGRQVVLVAAGRSSPRPHMQLMSRRSTRGPTRCVTRNLRDGRWAPVPRRRYAALARGSGARAAGRAAGERTRTCPGDGRGSGQLTGPPAVRASNVPDVDALVVTRNEELRGADQPGQTNVAGVSARLATRSTRWVRREPQPVRPETLKRGPAASAAGAGGPRWRRRDDLPWLTSATWAASAATPATSCQTWSDWREKMGALFRRAGSKPLAPFTRRRGHLGHGPMGRTGWPMSLAAALAVPFVVRPAAGCR